MEDGHAAYLLAMVRDIPYRPSGGDLAVVERRVSVSERLELDMKLKLAAGLSPVRLAAKGDVESMPKRVEE
jgi:hypothetical protein